MIPDNLIHILKDVSDDILNAKDAESLAKAAHRIVERFVPVPYSGIYLWIPSENKIKLLSSVGFTKEEDEVNEKTAMERHPGHVFKTREILYVTDMYSERVPKFVTDLNRKKEVRSRLWMPICTDTRSLGSFGFASDKVDFFTQIHRDVLDYICRLVANQYVNMLQAEAEAEFSKKLNDAYLKINEAFRVQSQFTAKMNHELRTPLNSIMGLLRILEQTQLDSDQLNHIKLARDQSKVLLSLVNDVLDISKIQENEFRVVEFDMNLETLLKDIVRVMEFNAKTKGLTLKLSIDKSLPTFIKSDDLRLRQILNNLLSNAIKFTEKGHVSLKVKHLIKENTPFIEFEVKDSGIGIPTEKLPHVFDKFYQVSEEIEIKYGGSGLGLTIVKEIIDRMNGRIDVKSKTGHGTTFTVLVPLKVSEAAALEEMTQNEEIDLQNRKILIIDDNAINCQFLSHILHEKGGITMTAEDGLKAIEILRKDADFDLLLMDIRMPHMSGIECTAFIRKNLELNIPIIVQSGNTIERDIESCYAVGANDFISKPINESDLYRKILIHSVANPFRKPIEKKPKIDLNDTLKGLFENAVIEFMSVFDNALKEENFEVLQFEVHKFKSSLKQLGYDDLSALAIEIEKRIIEGHKDEQTKNECNRFLKKIELLKKEIVST